MQPASPVLRENCPVCGSRDLLPSVALKALPTLCNVLYPDPASARAAQTGRFVTTFCRSCGHLFNAAFEKDRVGYTQSYENSLHYSPRFVAFADALAERLNRTYALNGKTIIDIGCGKGDFLSRLCLVSGASGVGFDKSFHESRDKCVPGVRFVKDWFDETYADLQPDFIACRHVLEHIAEPALFLQTLRAHPGVGPNTVFYFEVPNALYTLRDLGIWDLIYEHVSYFSLPSLRLAFELAGFEILDAGTSFGEQYLYIEAKAVAVKLATPSLDEGFELLLRAFDSAYRDKVARWRNYLAARDPSQCVVWGAGSKGVTFVNVVPGAEQIGALVDVNPFKQGRFVPGTGTPVVAPQAWHGRSVQSIIVMNPLYRNEISETAAMLGFKSEILAA